MFDLIPHIEKLLVVPLGPISYITHFVFSQWQSPSQVEGAVSKHYFQIENGTDTDQAGLITMPFLTGCTIELENPY